MTIGELIFLLAKYPDTMQVMVLDGPNGGGVPRDMNIGPVRRTITIDDSAETADCEGIEGQTVVVVGFGCY